jgi:hypothetical protein
MRLISITNIAMPKERDPTTYGPYRYPEAKNHSIVKNVENPPQIVENKARRISCGYSTNVGFIIRSSKYPKHLIIQQSKCRSYGELSKDVKSPMAFISRSNCEYELSGIVSKSSSSASLGSIGDVGGVVNWAD